MNIGTIKEIKERENRVGLSPVGVAKLAAAGHSVWVEKGAGLGAGFSDREYRDAGARIAKTPIDVVEKVDILAKVKEPLAVEYDLLDRLKAKTIFTFLHLAGVDRELTLNLIRNGITAISYDTVEDRSGSLPILRPMSEIAGVLAAHYAAEFLQKKHGGRGVTIGYISNARPAEVVVVGGGVVGAAAARTATGMGASVKLFDIDGRRIRELKGEMSRFFGDTLARRMKILNSNRADLSRYVKEADALIGAVLVRGARPPQVVTEKMVRSMKTGAVIVDVAIDQGGCVWGARPTSHGNPTYNIEDKIFCCVPNMPSQAPLQATEALTHATFPHLLKMANMGVARYIKSNPHFARGVNVYNGKIAYEAVARALDLMNLYRPLEL